MLVLGFIQTITVHVLIVGVTSIVVMVMQSASDRRAGQRAGGGGSEVEM